MKRLSYLMLQDRRVCRNNSKADGVAKCKKMKPIKFKCSDTSTTNQNLKDFQYEKQ